MAKFFVIATVGNYSYLTKVDSDSICAAEHFVLDMGVCGRREYAVTGCCAFDEESMRTDAFVYEALAAHPIDIGKLYEIIKKRNEKIIAEEKRLERISELEKELNKLQSELEELKKGGC